MKQKNFYLSLSHAHCVCVFLSLSRSQVNVSLSGMESKIHETIATFLTFSKKKNPNQKKKQ